MTSLMMGILVEKILLLMMMMIFSLVSVSFLTLFERKLLSFIQIRKGPNKVGLIGIVQPFSDAMKLLTKELFKLKMVNLMIFYICPMMMLILSMLLLLCLNKMNYNNSLMMGMLFMLSCLSVSSYFIMFSGWSSNSMYSLLGSIRSVAQVISYEVSMIFILMSVMLMIESFSLYKMSFNYLMIMLYPLMLLFFISILAELNRTPFDLIEGESELVSGFNVEYFSGGFTLIFLSEYLNILFMSMFFVSLFMNVGLIELYFLLVMMVLYLILSIRGVLPRIRYDELMSLCWMKILPISMNYLIYISCVKFLLS